ncbi:PfkB family carbohydrate kinase [Microbacterium resistens]|uniref:PfkB family carbohydrate kinase n=1 Tax=Microbacterium resistens TaxID=156977 RepID=UPI0022F02982|nr:PfkB family carbohydrate kinase [Streptomyces sp. MS2A]
MTTLGVRGGLSVDHLVIEGEGARFRQLGGPALFAVLGARLVEDVDVRVSTALPEDDPRFAALFDRLGVDRSFSAPVPHSTRLWILNALEGRRIVDTAAPGELELEADGAPVPEEDEVPSDPGFFRGLDALLDSAPLRMPETSVGTTVGIDPHQVPMARAGLAYLRNVTPPGGLILPSRVQLGLIDADVRAAARRIADELATPVIARLDSEGMFVVDAGGGGTWTIRDDRVIVRETTGAGDASAAAIMAAVARGVDLVTAAMIGAAVARVALADWGAAALLDAEPFTAPPVGVTATQEKK